VPCGERIDLENFQDSTLVMPLSAYFWSKASSTARAFSPYLAKTLRFFTFSARSFRVSGGLVEGDVADQIEGVVVAAHLLGEFIEEDTLGGQFLQDGLLLLGVVPHGEEGIERGVGLRTVLRE
jgi:hypothetical protein